jgi:hypothetical protein
MRSCLLWLSPALLAACGPYGYPPTATAVAAPPPSLALNDAFAAQRPLDAPPDPVRVVADGSATVQVAVLSVATATPGIGLEPAALRAEVERNAGLLQRCWESRAPALTVREGVVEIHAQLDARGRVHEQCIGEDSIGDDAVRRCVNDLVSMGRYPASDTTADFTLQLRLLPLSR